MNLVIDFGNTFVKVGIEDNKKITNVEKFETHNLDIHSFQSLIQKVRPEIICYLAVSKIEKEVLQIIHQSFARVIHFTHDVALPFKINYNPLQSLGIDRLAGVIGARSIYPNENFLLIQAGTCITYDLYSERDGYLGGAIAPGIHIRNLAMNTFTYQLPLVSLDPDENCEVIATSTNGSLKSGILNAALFEIEGFISHAREILPKFKVILSGGDMIYFVKKIKSQIFAHSNLTLIGLTEIIRFNE